MQKFTVFLICFLLIFPVMIFAKSGVGIGTGKIELSEPLKSGAIYKLPSLTIFNTGDERGRYRMDVEYQQGQEEGGGYFQPAREWFTFDPPTFELEPGKAQAVQVQLTLPLKTVPGRYFAYLEGQTVHRGGSGGATIGVAAAAQLYFKVAPANIFQALYYRTSALFKKYSPWSWVGLWLVVGAIVIIIFRAIFKKFFKLQIGISRKEQEAGEERQKTTVGKQKRTSKRHKNE